MFELLVLSENAVEKCLDHDGGFLLQHGRVKRSAIDLEPVFGCFYAVKAEVQQAKEQRCFDGVLARAFRQRVSCDVGIIVDPRRNRNQRVRQPVAGAGDPKLLGKLLDGIVADEIDVKISDNADDGFADFLVIAKLLLDYLIQTDDIFMGDLLFLALHQVVPELLNLLVNLTCGCLNALCCRVNISDMNIYLAFKAVHRRVELVDQIIYVRHSFFTSVYCLNLLTAL